MFQTLWYIHHLVYMTSPPFEGYFCSTILLKPKKNQVDSHKRLKRTCSTYHTIIFKILYPAAVQVANNFKYLFDLRCLYAVNLSLTFTVV